MVCECGNILNDNAVFCSKCGKKVNSVNKKFCTKCGCEIKSDAVYCDSCGEVVVKKSIQPPIINNNIQNTQPQNNSTTNGTSNSTDNRSVGFYVLIAFLGAIIGWYLSGVIGFGLGVFAFSVVAKKKSQGECGSLPFAITLILAIICVIFWIIAMGA